MMRCGIMIQIVVACRSNRRSARPRIPRLSPPPRAAVLLQLACCVALFAARRQHFRQPVARLSNRLEVAGDIDDARRHVRVAMCLWPAGSPHRAADLGNVRRHSSPCQHCSKVPRKRSILIKYASQVVGWYCATRPRISDAALLPSANMQTSASQPGPSVGSR